MKIAVISRTVKNVGDDLWFYSAVEILHKNFPKAQIDLIHSFGVGIEQYTIQQFSSIYDYYVIAGGPCIRKTFTNYCYPWVKDINPEKLILLGVGVDADGVTARSPGLQLLSKAKLITCRDILAYQILKQLNKNTYLSGCMTIWNDLDNFSHKVTDHPAKSKRVIVSLPCRGVTPNTRFIRVSELQIICDKICKDFSGQNFEMIFTQNDDRAIIARQSRQIITSTNIPTSGKVISHSNLLFPQNHQEMAEQICGAQLHIGFRLHSHLLALALGIPSVLVVFDARTRQCRATFKEYCYELHEISEINLQHLAADFDPNRLDRTFKSSNDGWLKALRNIAPEKRNKK